MSNLKPDLWDAAVTLVLQCIVWDGGWCTVKMSKGRGVSRVGWIMDSRLGRWPSLEPTKNNLGKTERRTLTCFKYKQHLMQCKVYCTVCSAVHLHACLSNLEEVNKEPLTDPKQDRPTNTGMIQAIGPKWKFPKSCSSRQETEQIREQNNTEYCTIQIDMLYFCVWVHGAHSPQPRPPKQASVQGWGW